MLNQKLKLKLSQKLSPQQIQLMKLIQLSTQEFEQKLSREIEENPALDNISTEEKDSDEIFEGEDFENDSNDNEEFDINDYLSDDDIPDYKLRSNNYSDEEEKDIPFTSGTSFNQFLKTQLHSFSLKGKDLQIASAFIALTKFDDGEKRYIIAQDFKVSSNFIKGIFNKFLNSSLSLKTNLVLFEYNPGSKLKFKFFLIFISPIRPTFKPVPLSTVNGCRGFSLYITL